MFRSTVFILVIGLMLGCSVHSEKFTESQEGISNFDKLDGVYEFISESTVLTEPKGTAYKRTSPEWSGMWQFQKGYFARVLMKRRRDTFFDPRKWEDFGFESSAGRYEIAGKSVRFIQDQAFHPFDVDRSALMDYRFEQDSLVLTQTLQPYLEDLRKGTITIVLRRLK